MNEWKIADIDPKELQQIHRLEQELGVILIAWTKKS